MFKVTFAYDLKNHRVQTQKIAEDSYRIEIQTLALAGVVTAYLK